MTAVQAVISPVLQMLATLFGSVLRCALTPVRQTVHTVA